VGILKIPFVLFAGAILSQHIGDLRGAMTFAGFQHTLTLFQHVHQHQPRVIAVDQHPQYVSANLGRDIAEKNDLKLIEVQHHHAHIAACLADNQRPLSAPPVLAVTLDGMGYANTANGAQIWGGEIFLADYHKAKRLACLKPVSLPGGNVAMQQPWRNCMSQLQVAVGWQQVVDDYAGLPLVKRFSRQPVNTLLRMID
jgi:hydrogenase maturation protein HypF